MNEKEFLQKIKELKINVTDEYFFLEYNKCVFNLIRENKQLKEKLESSNLIKYLPNIVKLISSGEIQKEVYDKYLGNVPCGYMSEKQLLEWFLEKSEK